METILPRNREHICQQCGKTFTHRKKGRKYCSRLCYDQRQRKLPDAICKLCGKTFRPKSHRSIFCDKWCSTKWTATHRTNARGWYRTQKGYICTYQPDHPRASQAGYVMQHRLVMEEVLGRLLTEHEVVHHINKVKDDNRPENLQVTTKLEHDKKTRGKRIATCPHCGEEFHVEGHVRIVGPI